MPNLFPSALPGAGISRARRPTQGGECELWLSTQRAFIAATQTGGSGQPCTVFEKPILAGDSRRLAVVLLSPASGTTLGATVGVYGRDQDGVALSGEAEIDCPGWLAHPSGTPMPAGSGYQVSVPTGKQFSRIDAVYPPAGLKVAVVAVPSDASFFHAGCVNSREIPFGREFRAAPTGSPREIQRHLPGGDMAVTTTPPGSFMSGPGSFLGGSCVGLFRTMKEGANPENLLVVDWSVSERLSAPEGGDVVTAQFSGPFACVVRLLAPDA